MSQTLCLANWSAPVAFLDIFLLLSMCPSDHIRIFVQQHFTVPVQTSLKVDECYGNLYVAPTFVGLGFTPLLFVFGCFLNFVGCLTGCSSISGLLVQRCLIWTQRCLFVQPFCTCYIVSFDCAFCVCNACFVSFNKSAQSFL